MHFSSDPLRVMVRRYHLKKGLSSPVPVLRLGYPIQIIIIILRKPLGPGQNLNTKAEVNIEDYTYTDTLHYGGHTVTTKPQHLLAGSLQRSFQQLVS